MKSSIPKIIHYCWFGGKPLPESALKCIESWKKNCPSYEIRRWDESNYDVTRCKYCREAYKAQKWAFVSDYARFDIVYAEGGVYLDTDVELIKPIDELLSNECYMGCEVATEAGTGKQRIQVNPGLGFGAVRESRILKKILEHYNSISYDGSFVQKTIGDHVTEILNNYGYKKEDRTQFLNYLTVYSSEYFCPLNNMTGELNITSNTKSIHWYDASWMTASGKIAVYISRMTQNRGHLIEDIGTILSIPFRLINRIETNGFKNTVKYIHSNI